MSVYFNGDRNHWTYDSRLNGKRFKGYALDPNGEPCSTKTEARRAEALIRAQALQQTPAPAPPVSEAFTVAQMFALMAVRKSTEKNWNNNRIYLAELVSYFGGTTPEKEITEQRTWDYIAWARACPKRVYLGGGLTPSKFAATHQKPGFRATVGHRAESTINRYLACLRAALRIAHDARDGTGRRLVPHLPRVPKLGEPEHLPRPIADPDLDAICRIIPAHLAAAIRLVRWMGFRKAEVFSLRINQVDFSNRGVWLAAESTKAGRAEFVGGPAAAMDLLCQLVAYRHGRDGKPKPIKNPRRAFSRALKTLGLEHRFHDTKASFVTAVAHVAPAAVTQKLAGHKSYETTQRYQRVADQAARSAIEAAAAGAAAPIPPHRSPTRYSIASRLSVNSLKDLVGAAGFEPTTPSPPD
ncbi:MAG: tyrosine-type recombinase/integrase [Azospirillum sp.]|nr:tyrosine-type recombinase/integrase [Azospirillum sp.]